MRHLERQGNILLTMVLIIGVFSFLGTAGAGKWYLGSEAEFLLDVTLSYGSGIRVSDRDEELLANTMHDDSNRNFDQWDFYNNKITAIADIEFIYKNVGVFVRPKAFYDHVYMTNNSNDGSSNDNNSAYVGGLIQEPDEWAEEVEDIHGLNAEILDAFAYTNFRVGEIPFDLRVGNQVISWGESSYIITGISSAQAPMDFSAATAVGTEVKEMYLPTGAIYLQTGYGDVGLRAYYQWEWEKSRFMEGGTFFSSSDMLDEIKAPLLYDYGGVLVNIPRTEDEEPRDDGQYGVALSYMLPWAATEIAGYYINYHEKNQAIVYPDPATVLYRVIYPEDIKLYGFSVSSVVGDAQIGAEFAYRDDIIFQDPELRGPESLIEGGYWQAQACFTYLKSPGWFGVADRIIVSGEAAYGAQDGLEGRNEEGFKYVAVVNFDWFQVLQRTDFGFNVKYSATPKGDDYLKAVDFQENKNSVSVGVDFMFNDVWEGDLTYENRLHNHDLADRDTLAFKLSYSF